MTIPEGYVLVPQSWADAYFSKAGWVDIEEPTLSQVCDYLNIGPRKLKSDLNKIGCPLRKTYQGTAKRGDQSKFLKRSVEEYKKWLEL